MELLTVVFHYGMIDSIGGRVDKKTYGNGHRDYTHAHEKGCGYSEGEELHCLCVVVVSYWVLLCFLGVGRYGVMG